MNPIIKPNYTVKTAPKHYKTVKQFEKWAKNELNRVKNDLHYDMGRSYYERPIK